MGEEKERLAAIDRIGHILEEADTANRDTVTVMRADLHLMFDELDRLHEMEDDAWHAGVERDLLT
jgi:hypothetical protein